LGAAHERGWTKPHAWALPAGVVGLIAASLVTPAGGLGFALPAVAIVTGVLALEARGTARAWPIAKLLGDASYAIYLFHPLVLFVLRQAFLRLPIAGWPQFLIFFPVAIVVTAACGIVVHLTVETWLARRLRRRRRVTAGAVTQAA
ncbi:MAG: acyltransferase family protein, partial [Sphingomonas sp.]